MKVRFWELSISLLMAEMGSDADRQMQGGKEMVGFWAFQGANGKQCSREQHRGYDWLRVIPKTTGALP